MHLILIAFLHYFPAQATTSEVTEAKASIRSLIAPLLPGKSKAPSSAAKDFRVDQCQREKIDWSDVLLMRKSVTLEFKFKDGCDIEGTITPKIFSPFPVELKLRKLENYDRIRSMNRVGASFESNPLMDIALREGVLWGKKGKLRFEADYKIRLDPVNQKNPVKENLGGEIRISEIDGKKVSIKEKIKIDR